LVSLKYGEHELAHLRRRDRNLGRIIDRIGMLERRIEPDLFPALVNSIVAQQISGKAADTVRERVKKRFGTIEPQRLARAAVEDIRSCGMSIRKAEYIHGIAESCANGALDLNLVKEMPDQEAIARLSALRGVGAWTAEMLLIFSLGRPDVVSWNDLGIRRGMTVLYGLKELSRADFDRYRQRYSPYGSIASLYLWEIARDRSSEGP
jgi:DNA-3-methyladenine glycosylase II